MQFFESFPEKKEFTSIGVPSEKLCPIYGGPSEVCVGGGEIEMDTNRWMEFFLDQFCRDGWHRMDENKTELRQI